MQIIPFQHEVESPPRKWPFNEPIRDAYGHVVPAVVGVKMRRCVIVVVHRDYDTQEP